MFSSMWYFFFFSSRRRHTRFSRDWSSDVCSSDLVGQDRVLVIEAARHVAADLIAYPFGLLGERRRRGRQRRIGRGALAEQRSEERRVGKEWWSRAGRGQQEN